MLKHNIADQPQCCLTTSQIVVGFLVAVLSIRSLSKHIIDIAGDPFIRNVNIILLTETQVLYNQVPNIQNQFENHQLLMHNDPIDLFRSLMFFLKKQYFVFHTAI